MAFTGAYLITEFGNEKGYFTFSRLLTHEFYIEFGSSLFIALVLVELIAWLTRALDLRYGWRDQTVMRVIFQVILCIALPVLVDFLLASFYFWIFGANILDTSYMMYSMPYIASLLTIFNVYYLAYYLAKVGPGNSKTSVVADVSGIPESPGASDSPDAPVAPVILYDYPMTNMVNEENIPYVEMKSEPDEPVAEKLNHGFMGHKGMDSCFFPIEKICYFFLENKASYLHTFDGESWLVDLSLRAIEKDIREVDFFRLHRQLIIHRKTIKKFVRWQGGRLKMILIPKLPGQLRSTVSQKKVSVFRKWIKS